MTSSSTTEWTMPGPNMERLATLLPHDPELQAYQPIPSVQALVDDAPTTVEVVQQLCQGYADRVALRWCLDGATTPDYTHSMTYRELWENVQTMATVLSKEGWLRKKEFVAVCGFASPGWVMVDVLGLYLGAVIVPLPLNVPFEDLKYMLDESGARVVFVAAEEAESLVGNVLGKEGACPSVETVVVMDYGKEEKGQAWVAKLRPLLPASVVRVMTMQELLLMHDKSSSSSSVYFPPAVPGAEGWEEEPNPLLGLMYTSGSTGRPKGAMYTEKLMRALWHTGFSWGVGEIPVVSLGFLPLNHIVGRVTIYQSITKGGVVYFVRRSDMSTLFEDFARAKPTKTMMVPRIANMAYETYQLKKAELLQAAGLSLPSSSSSSPSSSSPQQQQQLNAIEHTAREYIRDEIFGGRLLFAIVGTAPSSAAVSNLIQEACEMPMVEGYGSTELGGITIENHINDATVLKWKLIDVPELGYTLKDHPYPRGELLVLTTTAIPGYYKHPEATNELIDSEGLYSTGDIMEQRGGEVLVWIDRRKNVLKLAQGEYVSVSRVEALFAGNADIANIYLYGNSLRSYVLGVVVPSEGLVEAASEGGRNGGNGGGEGGREEVVARLKPLLRQRLDAVAKEAGLASYEVPRDFIVQLDGFTRENNLMTDSNKLARARLKQVFGPRLEAMYTAVEERKGKRLESLQANPNASITEQVRAALEMTLGLGEEVGLDASFAQLGGDSLSAVRVTEHLKRLCGVGVPVAELLNPAATLQSLVEHLEAKKRGGGEGGGEGEGEEEVYERVHGPEEGASFIFAKDLTVDKFIPAAVLHPPEAKGAMDWASKAGEGLGEGGAGIKGVLLTGANGFLGRFLLLELLSKLQGENRSSSSSSSSSSSKVYCIVRARDDAAAKARLWEAVGASLLEPYQERIVVLAGDVSQPRLGLSSKEAYASLAEKVDLVLHAGALVNHNLSYRELFGPNVLGTTNIMQFCLTPPSKPKPLHFVSTVAVAMGEGGPGPHVTEAHLGSFWGKERRIEGGAYAEGYGASKWASEVLLQDLNKQTGLPVVAYRCSMILPHTSLPGQINVSDVFTRLLAGVIYTGIAPQSFTDGQGQAPAYDGSPVDFVAGGIVAIAVEGGREGGCRLFHVVNPHGEEGASLDDIVGWVKSAGYAVEGVAPYQGWFDLFKSKLEALPSDKRNQSPLPVLHQWQTPVLSRKKMEGVLVLDATCFRAAVKRLTKWGDVPMLSEEYLHTCLYHMSVLGLIGATPVVAKAAVSGEK